MKNCRRCRLDKPKEAFALDSRGKAYMCLECVSKQDEGRDPAFIAYQKEYRRTNKTRISAKIREIEQRHRDAVFEHYGKNCACCGESRREFLAIDHIHDGGNRHRQLIRKRLEYWLKDNNYPAGFRTLCHNCNVALGRLGYCPHDRERNLTETPKEVS